jgi:hypothetical protein
MSLEALIGRARQGDLDAFAEVTRRFQQMAFGYAVALLRDLQQEHAALAARVRDALVAAQGDGAGPRVPPAGSGAVAMERARKLWRFFAQPFFVAEPYTKRPGIFVSRAEALRGCREILDGVPDDVPDDAFYFTGGIDEIRARAARP